MHSKEGFFVGHKKKKGLGLFGGKEIEKTTILQSISNRPRGLFLEVI